MKIKKIILIFNNLLKTNFGRAKILKVVKNFLVLQIKKKLSQKPFVFKTCSKSFAFVQKGIDSSSISGLFYYGLNEFNEVLFAWHILRPDDIFFDIGANQGSWGLILCPKKIICHQFEPSTETFEILKKQISLNERFKDYLIPHKKAISNKNSTVNFTKDFFTSNQIIEKNKKDINYEKVKSITLNSASEKYGMPTLIKIDVEGFNYQVLEKGNKVLENPTLKALIIETFRRQEFKKKSFIEFEELLASYGFYPYSYNPIMRTIKPITKTNDPLLNDNDTIYFRVSRDDLILLKESKPLKVLGKYY